MWQKGKAMRKIHTTLLSAIGMVIILGSLTACGGGGSASPAATNGGAGNSGAGNTGGGNTGTGNSGTGNGGNTSTTTTLSPAAQLGQLLFVDKNLSSGKNMSCETCHDPAYAYGPPNSLAVQLGSDGVSWGLRATPSLRYKSMTPAYSDNAENPDGITANAPGGGFFWDGRAKTLADQAGGPMLNPLEMNNASQADVVQKVSQSAYANQFKQVYGQNVFADVATAFSDIEDAIQAYETEDPSFHPFSSKFDLALNNKVGGDLTPAELRGLGIFNSGSTGNCNACHYEGANFTDSAGNASQALMTDFTYQAVGAPRNDASIPNNPSPIPANADSTYIDMGLCGPGNDGAYDSHTPGSSTSGAGPDPYTGVNNPDPYCGRFKVPTLRNIATRTAFFHNGVFHSLQQVLQFYNTRDTHPEYWYPASGGTGTAVNNPSYALQPTYVPGATVNKFNDLPAIYQGNIDEELPMGQGQTDAGGTTLLNGALPRPAGSAPIFSDQDIQDLICFMNTLSDGYQPPATPPTSGTCVN